MNQAMIRNAVARVMPAAIATGLAVSTITIQKPSGNYDPAGAPDGTFVDVAGLVGLKCMAAPPSLAKIQATEMKALAEIASMELKHVWLEAYYPQIESDWRAVLDAVVYDILGSEWDSQSQMTRMTLRLVQV